MSRYSDFFNKTSIVIKHFDTLPNDDSLQWGMYGSNQDRYFKDATTDIFTKNFLSNDKMRWMFVDYVYHVILFNLNTQINKKLLELYNTYLYKNEFITLLFKGGNVMNLYYGDLKEQINEYKKNCQYQFHKKFVINNVAKFLDNLDNNFQISDVDFSIYVACFDYIKYLKITHCAKIIVAETLQKIGIEFDRYFDSVMSDTFPVTPVNPIKTKEIVAEDVIKQEDKLRIFLEKLKKNIIDLNEENLGDLVEKTTIKFNKPHQLIKLYLVFEKLAINNKLDISSELEEIRSVINSEVNTKLNNILSNNFYTKNKIDEFRSKIKKFYLGEKFCVKFKDEYTNQKHLVHIFVYEGEQEVEPLLAKRKSAIVHSSKQLNNPTKIIDTEPDLMHYISYNTSILKLRVSGTSDFDLFRIKFNVKLENVIKEYVLTEDYDNFVEKLKIQQKNRNADNEINSTNNNLFVSREEFDKFIADNKFKLEEQETIAFNVPSEFIDVSMPSFQDATAQHFIKNSDNDNIANIFKIIDNVFLYTDCYSKTEIYDDLNVVLFSQNTYFPWVDKKYDKRIRRLITMLVISKLVFTNGRYTLGTEMRQILKNLIFTCVVIYNSLNSGIDYNIDYNEIRKYMVDESNHDIKINVIAHMINSVNKNNQLVDFRTIVNINNKYQCIRYLLNLILIFYKLFSQNSDTHNENIVKFINAYKIEQLWEPFDVSDSNNVVAELKKKYTVLLKTIIDNGQILLLIF